MRAGALPTDIALVINNAPCRGRLSCDQLLPSLMPDGATLTVYVADTAGTRLFKTYRGTGTRLQDPPTTHPVPDPNPGGA